jgi:hypothetical protein
MLVYDINGVVTEKTMSFNSSTLPFGTLLADKMYIEYDLSIAFTKLVDNAEWQLQELTDSFGLRPMPMQSNSNITYQLNNTTFNLNGFKAVEAMLFLLNNDDEKQYLGMSTMTRDLNPTNTLVSGVRPYQDSIFYVDNRNIMNYLYKIEFTDRTATLPPQYPDIMTHYYDKDFKYARVYDNNTNVGYNKITLYLKVREPLVITPLMFTNKMTHLTNLRNINMSIVTETERFFEGSFNALTYPNNNFVVDNIVFNNAKLHLTYKKQIFNHPTDNIIFYDYILLTKPLGNITILDASVTTNDNVLITENKFIEYKTSLLRITHNPKYIIIYCLNDDVLGFDANTFDISTNFLQINKLNIKVNDNNELYHNFNSYDLYRLSINNNLNMTYSQFSARIGSVIILSRDDLLNKDEILTSIEYTIDIRRQTTSRIINSDVTLCTLLVYEKIFTNDF